MRPFIVLSITALLLTACQQASPPETSSLHPFIGCWENDTGLEREGWTIDPSGWLVGYAASRDAEGQVTFFEHMRIERSEESEMLVVTGRDNSETHFKRQIGDDREEYRFENSGHDYPQLIVYKRKGDDLNAYIALMDGTKKVTFDKSVCKGN